ncbi:MAG: acyl-[ACP]--phospholipid O-acyltransferase [Rickettsiaceae bacterium]|nr:acyl-[ACP]--phospholipid O-acyltransferase [Rickettsiaceae bacterium]
MRASQTYLITDRRFYPMLITQACSCFNDNLLKSSVVMLVTFSECFGANISSQILIALANVILIAPFILFAGIAGQIADKYDKAKVVQIIKLVEIGLVVFAIYGFMKNDLFILMLCIGLMGTHSAFFIPIKYSIVPEHLEKHELIAANGYLESFTFVTILLGTLLGGLAINGVYSVLILMFVISVIGFLSSLAMLPSTNISPNIKLNPDLISETISIVQYAATKKQVFLAIMGISWFWFVGGAFMAQIPTLTKETFWADQYVANLFLAIFTVGLGIGAFLCHHIFGHEIQTRYVFLSSILLSLFGIDLFFACRISEVSTQTEELRTLSMFLSKKYNWRIIIDFFCLSVLDGLYIVPLYAVLQCFSPPAHRSRVIAANGVMNALFMIASNALIYALVYVGCSVTTIIFMIVFINAIVSFYIYQMIPENEVIPESFVKMIFKFYFDKFHRVEVKGIENFAKAGKRVVIVANHPSYMEPALLAVYLPEKPIFAIRTRVTQYWWVKPLRKLVKTYPLDTSNPMAIKYLIGELNKNKKIVIFPEGRRSTTGTLMKIYEGPGMIADKSDSMILPIRIDGTQFAISSRAKHIIKNNYFPKITITLLPPVKIEAPDNLESKERRKYLSNKLYTIMSDMMFESSEYEKPLFESLVDCVSIFGKNFPIIMDTDNPSLTYRDLITRSYILGGLFAKLTKSRENVGLMLPTSCGATISFYGLQAYNRVPTMLNFTSGYANIISACHTSKVRTIFTSRAFVQRAELQEMTDKIAKEFNVVYLEDLRNQVSISDKLNGFIGGIFPRLYYKHINKTPQNCNELAAILFTSGTEGNPKAVAVSHRNIQANTYQMKARVDFLTTDIVFNSLPMFHSFGLMAGCVMPILAGVRTYFYPSPLHYRIIPELIYDIDATIMLGTDTFLNGYAKYADPYDFYAIRYAFAGAEKLKPETRQIWFDKFGVRIFEGYGVTEASPVVSVNTPMHDLPGSVGKFLPKIESHLVPVEGIKDAGKLCIKGPNIMMGYIHHTNPGVITPPSVEGLGDGWYDTGDIVNINEEGYVTIKGRAKRFAKIAGEMVSLASVEEVAQKVDSRTLHAAIHVSDEQKGEQIILFTESELITRESFIDKLNVMGLSKLLVPKIISKMKELPVLSTGKMNYRKLLELSYELIKETE